MDGNTSTFGVSWDPNFPEDRENGFFHGLYETGSLMTEYPDISSASVAQTYATGPSMSGHAFQNMTVRNNDFTRSFNSHASAQSAGVGNFAKRRTSVSTPSNTERTSKRRKASRPSNAPNFPLSNGMNNFSQTSEQSPWAMGPSKSDYLTLTGTAVNRLDPNGDDDASSCSSCPASCSSHCGETGQGSICCDAENCDAPAAEDLCVDEACVGANNPCTDQNCYGDTLPAAGSREEEAAAEALASFGDMGDFMSGHALPDGLSSGHFDFNSMNGPIPLNFQSQVPDQGHNASGLINTSGAEQFQLTSNSGSFNNPAASPWYSWDFLYHLKNFHQPSEAPTAHVRPCAADNPALMGLKCPLPADSNFSEGFPHANFTIGGQSGDQCGFSANNPSMLADHLTNNHGSFLQNLPNSDPGSMQHTRPGFDGLSPRQRIQGTAGFARPHGFDMSFAGQMFDSGFFSSQPREHSPHLLTPETLSSGYSSPPVGRITGTGHKIQSLGPQQAYECRWKDPETGVPCLQNFGDADALDAHAKSHHTKDAVKHEGGFKCLWDSCKRAGDFFTTRAKLNRHLQTHTGYKPMACPYCSMRLSAKQALDQHIRTHTNEKPYKCQFNCGATFKQHSALTMHHRVHTKEKPLKCDVCNAVFTESSNLSKHKRIHDDKGSYECAICSKNFHRLDQLRRHFTSTHRDQPDAVVKRLLDLAHVQSKELREANKQMVGSKESEIPNKGILVTDVKSSPKTSANPSDPLSGRNSFSSDSLQDFIKSENPEFGTWETSEETSEAVW